MAEFLEGLSLFPLALTFGTYQIGLWCQKKWKSPLLNPILIAVVLTIGVILLCGIDLQVYQTGASGISWLLTPATVCLALPLYKQIKILKKHLPAILTGILAGTVTSLVFIFALCKLLSLDDALTISLLPKSITTAIGMVLSEQSGGYGSLTTAAIIITGNLGNLAGSMLCKLFRLTEPIAQGVALGTASHVVGTTRANELGELQGAVSSLSLAIAGIVTVIVFPLVIHFI
ncbi:MAG: LrgB family protein [Oscillospiraceae bacterium]|nr:LrgB family protein [Oscillospiraceae bacterium]